jgi:hypothetical protein
VGAVDVDHENIVRTIPYIFKPFACRDPIFQRQARRNGGVGIEAAAELGRSPVESSLLEYARFLQHGLPVCAGNIARGGESI